MWHDWKVFSAGWSQFLGVHWTDGSSQISAANLCGEDPKLKPQGEGNVRLFPCRYQRKSQGQWMSCRWQQENNKRNVNVRMKVYVLLWKRKVQGELWPFWNKRQVKGMSSGNLCAKSPISDVEEKSQLFRRTDANISKY